VSCNFAIKFKITPYHHTTILILYITSTSYTGTTNSDASGISEPSQTQTENSTTTLLNSSRGCSDGFYLDLELDVCRPQCGIWKPTSHDSQAVIDAFTIMALCIAVICGSAFLILALLQRKQM